MRWHAEAEACWRRRRRAYTQRVDFLRYLRGKLTGSGQKFRGPTRHRGAIHPIESETLLSFKEVGPPSRRPAWPSGLGIDLKPFRSVDLVLFQVNFMLHE
jgi:hypothetical protein